MKFKKVLFCALIGALSLSSLAACDEKTPANNQEKQSEISNVNTNGGLTQSSDLSELFSVQRAEYNNKLDSPLYRANSDFGTLNNYIVKEDIDENTDEEIVKQLKNAGFDGNSLDVIEGYKSEYKEVETGYATENVSLWSSAQSSVVFPGSVVRVLDPKVGNSSPVESYGCNVKDVTLSINTYTSNGTNKDAISRDLKSVNRDSVYNAIKDLVDQNVVNGANHASRVNVSVTEIKNTSQLESILGESYKEIKNSELAANISGKVNLSAFKLDGKADAMGYTNGNRKLTVNTENTSSSSSYYACVQLTQEYYTIETNLIYDTDSIIDEDLNGAKMKSLIKKGGVPGIVSGVTYGRKIVCLLELDCSVEEYKKELASSQTTNNGNGGGADIDAQLKNVVNVDGKVNGSSDNETSEVDDENTSSSAASHVRSSNFFIYGGSDNSQSDFYTTTNANEILDVIKNSSSVEDMVGVPISYRVSAIDGSNAELKVTTTDKYYERVLTPIAPSGKLELSNETIKELNSLKIGDTISFTAERTPVNAVLYPIEYDITFNNTGNDVINAIKSLNSAVYYFGNNTADIAATMTVEDGYCCLKLENDSRLIGKYLTVNFSYSSNTIDGKSYKKFDNSFKTSSISYENNINDKFTITFKDSNRSEIGKIDVSKDTDFYISLSNSNNTIDGLKYLNGIEYDGVHYSGWYRLINDKFVLSSNELVLTENITLYLQPVAIIQTNGSEFKNESFKLEITDNLYKALKKNVDVDFNNYDVTFYFDEEKTQKITEDFVMNSSYISVYVEVVNKIDSIPVFKDDVLYKGQLLTSNTSSRFEYSEGKVGYKFIPDVTSTCSISCSNSQAGSYSTIELFDKNMKLLDKSDMAIVKHDVTKGEVYYVTFTPRFKYENYQTYEIYVSFYAEDVKVNQIPSLKNPEIGKTKLTEEMKNASVCYEITATRDEYVRVITYGYTDTIIYVFIDDVLCFIEDDQEADDPAYDDDRNAYLNLNVNEGTKLTIIIANFYSSCEETDISYCTLDWKK